MNTFFKFITGPVLLPLLLAALLSCMALSCNKDEPEIQNDFPFEIEVRPIPKSLALNKTVEIRCRLKKEGNYNGTQYRIRYFQYDGEGKLSLEKSTQEIWMKCADCIAEPMEKKTVPYLQPNDPYLLPADNFNLYYTSLSEEQQSFTIWVKDNFGNERSASFEFTPKKTQ